MTRGATATIWTAAALWLLGPAACAGPPDREVEAEGAPRTAETEAAPGAPGAPATPFEEPPPGGLPEWDAALAGDLEGWLDAVARGLEGVVAEAMEGRGDEARQRALRLYLDHFELVEGVYGPGAPHGADGLAERVAEGEAAFHALLRADPREIPELAAELADRLEAIRVAARQAGVPMRPRLPAERAGGHDDAVEADAGGGAARPWAGPRHPEVAALLQELREAEAAYRAGDTAAALAGVERAYLEGFEPLEARLPMTQVRRVERLFHLRLRPEIARGAPEGAVEASFAALYGELAAVEEALARDARFWFGAFNAFVIILREGLEAVLLIGAILAYLSRVSSDPRHRRQVFAGAGLGVAASLGTWAVAQLLIPVGGASRELIEGVTALLAVCVLVYVSHWLFHKTYVHDWTRYLTGRVDQAVSTGSALAMAVLAFAAVYREGFETVLFYQALLMDVGAGAILAGFLPGLLLIVAVGLGIIRLGLRLPLRRVFAATNAILLYLAFVFLGKGLYNLQEAGLFAPHPLPWAPDHEALRQLLGIHPVAETLAAQAAFLLFVAGSYLYYRRRSGARSAPTEAAVAAGERRSRVRREGASDASPRAGRSAARQVPTSPSR